MSVGSVFFCGFRTTNPCGYFEVLNLVLPHGFRGDPVTWNFELRKPEGIVGFGVGLRVTVGLLINSTLWVHEVAYEYNFVQCVLNLSVNFERGSFRRFFFIFFSFLLRSQENNEKKKQNRFHFSIYLSTLVYLWYFYLFKINDDLNITW